MRGFRVRLVLMAHLDSVFRAYNSLTYPERNQNLPLRMQKKEIKPVYIRGLSPILGGITRQEILRQAQDDNSLALSVIPSLPRDLCHTLRAYSRFISWNQINPCLQAFSTNLRRKLGILLSVYDDVDRTSSLKVRQVSDRTRIRLYEYGPKQQASADRRRLPAASDAA